jgi:hypothetical protein
MTIMTTFEIIPLARNLEGKSITICLWQELDSLSSDDSEGKRVKKVCEFFDERYVKNRSVTDIDWSPKVSCHILFKSRST